MPRIRDVGIWGLRPGCPGVPAQPHGLGVNNHLVADPGSKGVVDPPQAACGTPPFSTPWFGGHCPVSESQLRRVARFTPSMDDTFFEPWPFSNKASAGERSISTFRRPQWVPRAWARRTPAVTLSRSTLASKEANARRTCNINFPQPADSGAEACQGHVAARKEGRAVPSQVWRATGAF